MNIVGKHALVTGGAGFIGSHIVDRLLDEGLHVRVLDDMSNGFVSNVSSRIGTAKFDLIKGDVRNQEIVRRSLEDVSLVLHQAAKVSVPLSIRNPHLVMDVNVIGTTVVLDECRKADVEKVIVASSSSIYGDTLTLPKVETMMPSPISPYGTSKLAEEHLARAFCSTYGLNATALRYFNVYGPRQRGGAYAGVISIFISKALENASIPIEGDGKQTRDFTYVDDVVDCNILAIESTKSRGKVYNVGGGSQITIKDLAHEIVRITGSKSTNSYGPPRPGDIRDSLAGIDMAKNELGYEPRTPIHTGLRKTVEWVK